MARPFAFFNKLGRRERMGAVAIAGLVVYFIMDAALLGPSEKNLKRLKGELTQVEGELNNLRADMTVIKAQLEKDPFAKDRVQLDEYKRAIDQANAFIASVDSDPRQVGALLRQLISATPGVTLVSMRTTPPQALSDPKGAAGGKPGASGTVYRRGIELTIRGNYLAMLPYLEKMQNLPQRVLWSEAELDVETYPNATLKLMIYTLSAQPDAAIG